MGIEGVDGSFVGWVERDPELADSDRGRPKVGGGPLPEARAAVVDVIVDAGWSGAYRAATGCPPGSSPRAECFWPPGGRDDIFDGDRLLGCSRPLVEDAEEAA